MKVKFLFNPKYEQIYDIRFLGYGSAFGEKYGNADRVEVACAALVRHGYSYIGKVLEMIRMRRIGMGMKINGIYYIDLFICSFIYLLQFIFCSLNKYLLPIFPSLSLFLISF